MAAYTISAASVLNQNCSDKGRQGAGSNDFADYRPKDFSKRDKSAKSTYFRKIVSD